MTKRKPAEYVIIVVCLAVVVFICQIYSRFLAQRIYQESSHHLKETFTQVNTTFSALVSKNWRILRGWEEYIQEIAAVDTEAFQTYIRKEKQDWSFTDFYFLSGDGNYMTADGRSGYLNLGRELETLVEGRENVVLDGSLPDADKIIIFAVPVTEGSYQGFSYTAIAISFNIQDLADALDIQSFSGQGKCYVSYGDGRIIFSSQVEEEQPYNLLAYLKKNQVLGEKTAEQVGQDWKDGASGVIRYRVGAKEYYLSYQPVGFSDWVMHGIVPVEAINSNMNMLTTVTMLVMAAIFTLIAANIVLLVISSNKRDIQKKNMEVRYREKLFDLLAQNTKDIFLLFSPETFAAEYVSQNLEQMFGIRAEEVRKDVRTLMATLVEGEATFSRENLSTIPKGATWTCEKIRHHCQTQERRWFKEMLYHAPEEEADRFVAVLSDRTIERQMTATLEEALDMTRAANEAKSNFLSNMSHDIRTPMNAIVGFSALLGRDADKPEKVREYTRKIMASSQHLLGLINDILDMSKIESGKTSLHITEFNLATLLDEIYTMLLPQANAKKQTFELHTKGVLPELLLGDKLRLNQILINLLSNAVKYTQEGGKVGLMVQNLEQKLRNYVHLQFVIWDNGYGMKEDFIEIIFEPFARENASYIKDIQGTGLGMAITKNIVDLMGGSISVKSKLGEGSTFTVDLEFALCEEELDADFWKEHQITKLLVVDDEEEICENILDIMADTGVQVVWVTEGRLAVEKAADARDRQEDYDIILVDWKMPDMDGVETARQIRAKVGPDIPILILTAYNFEEIEEEAKEAGIQMFLSKPFFLSAFRRALAEIYQKQEIGQAIRQKEEQRKQQSASLAGLRVLAAEDNEINAEILAELLGMEGIHCELAANGQEVVEKFLQSAPGDYDFIFMDVQMPVMDGYEATRKIRLSNHPEAGVIPIIAMTANAFEEDVQKALSVGMNIHTSKPIDMEKVKAAIYQLKKGEGQKAVD